MTMTMTMTMMMSHLLCKDGARDKEYRSVWPAMLFLILCKIY